MNTLEGKTSNIMEAFFSVKLTFTDIELHISFIHLRIYALKHALFLCYLFIQTLYYLDAKKC